MHRSILLFAASALLATAFAQQPSPANARPRVRRLPFGLQGNVHTVMTKIDQLRQDPRRFYTSGHWSVSPLSARTSGPTWLSFDERGRIVEQGTISADGKFASLTRNEGNTSTTTVQLPGKAPEITQHRTTNSAGRSTTETYRDGQLIHKMQTTFGGGHLEHQTYDTQGRMISEGSTDNEIQNNGRSHTIIFHDVTAGQNGVSQDRKIVDQFGEDHQSIEHSEYDGNGNVLCTLRVSGTTLTYSLMLAEAKNPCHISAQSKQDLKRYEYSLYPNGGSGELFTDIFSYSDRSDMQRYLEPDTVERLDSSGSVIDKVSFRYERDTQGNWTSRVVSVLDPATKDLVEIERDTRTITYYDQQ